MNKEKFSEDWTLLAVHRQYGKDEGMKLLFDEISRLKFEIGVLKSECSEKNDHVFKLKSELKQLKDKQPYKNAIKVMQETIYKLSKENESLKNKFSFRKTTSQNRNYE